MTISWREQSTGAWVAYSGKLIVGIVGHIQVGPEPRLWFYHLDGVSTKWVTKGFGEVKSRRQAKRSLERAWSDWLFRAALRPIAESRPEPASKASINSPLEKGA